MKQLMQVITETQLLEQIKTFLDRHQMAPTTFGRLAASEASFIASIEAGRSPSLKVVNRVVAFMKDKDREQMDAGGLPPPEEDRELPFVNAPVNHTGASSPTFSPTNAPQRPSAANGSCHSCSAEAAK